MSGISSGANSQGVLSAPPLQRVPVGTQVTAEQFNALAAQLERALIALSQPDPLRFVNAVNDAVAAAANVRVGQKYRNGSVQMVRYS